jgi:hypothetical protein
MMLIVAGVAYQHGERQFGPRVSERDEAALELGGSVARRDNHFDAEWQHRVAHRKLILDDINDPTG